MVRRWEAWGDGGWASWNWNDYLQRDARIGREGGLIEHQGTWFCPACEVEVAKGYLERHVTTVRHIRHQDYLRHFEKLAEKERRGELPPWMEIRRGWRYCTVCQNYATEPHVASAKHQRRLWYFEQEFGATQPSALTCGAAGPPAPGACAAAGSNTEVPAGRAPIVHQLWKADEVPPKWGNPAVYEWKDELHCWWCKLCWKCADNAHVYSDKHQNRMRHPEWFLQDLEDLPELYERDWRTVPQPLGWDAGGSSAGSNATLCEEQLLATVRAGFKAPIAGNGEGCTGGTGTSAVPAVEAYSPPLPGACLVQVPDITCPGTSTVPAVEDFPGVPEEGGYITFSMGDPVCVLYRGTSEADLGWSFGSVRQGDRGWFPSRCVAATLAVATLPQAPTPATSPAPTFGSWGGGTDVSSWL